ncbi:hypothetical protein [Pedosphaera parvula]|uniref:Uncharacterized protein n=1 Tax=Pedosphaera parvula (strain Ellin514) TaxID=320771 RepID=B9XPJ5_PEDPL|nr:hypothetical protein [Pedosphaera parvula]EEF58223.1 hypothetical protein Cflav_PD1423 [Pedosphaera parvula Ellin514]
MNSPIAALVWEIWQRSRRSAWVAIGCVSACALINLLILDRLGLTESSRAQFSPFFGLLMVMSFLFLMGIFNYTEFNSTKDWNGFPYRLFALPVRTWQLVALPMLLGVASVEVVYLAWIKLVWTHQQILMPEWLAVILGAYVVFYQTALWSLAGFRIMRIVALSFGGVSSIVVACLPFFARDNPSPWFLERRLSALVVGMAVVAFMIAWATVARQRCGGGHRRSWIKILLNRIADTLPRRRKDFASPAAAQFWFEWRRAGWLLPVCTGFVIVAIFAPVAWLNRHDPRDTNDILHQLFNMPFILAFVIGKGFIKCEFWSTNFSFPQFLAIRPLPASEFVAAKMKVAALSVAITWLLVLAFLWFWLSYWADTTRLTPGLAKFRMSYPHSWQMIAVLSFVGIMVLTWRCLVSGLWVGLLGNRAYYFGSAALQVIVLALVLLASAIWSDALDREIESRPDLVIAVVLRAINWLLVFMVVGKLWFAVFSWNKVSPGHTRQYLFIWFGATLCFLTLAILARPSFDVHRLAHLFLLAAFLVFPLARLGLAPGALAKNRHL